MRPFYVLHFLGGGGLNVCYIIYVISQLGNNSIHVHSTLHLPKDVTIHIGIIIYYYIYSIIIPEYYQLLVHDL